MLALTEPEDVTLGVDDSLGDDDHGVLLDVKHREYPLDQRAGLDGRLGHEDQIGLAVGGAQGNHAAVAAHHLHDGDPPVALGRRPDRATPVDDSNTAVA